MLRIDPGRPMQRATGLTWLALVLAGGLILPSAAAAAGRMALVIGNSAYEHVDPLPNPQGDARAVAAALERMKFDSVTLLLDQDQSGLRRALGEFAAQAAGADVALIYYAGHGIEVSGENYLIPIDARLAGAGDVDFETVNLSTAVVALERAAGLKLVILDACRDNPFRSRLQASASRSVSRGLARVEPVGRDIIIAYAAREGAVAADGDGTNSPYTSALLRHLETPGLDVRLLFGKVRDDVVSMTGGNQEPYIYESLGGDVVALVRSDPGSVPSAGAEEPVDREALYWSSVRDSSDPALVRSYLERYPDGEFAVLAHARLQALEPAEETPQVQEPAAPNPADESFRNAQAADASGDLVEAARLYLAASDQGHARATALLGYAYEYGRGVGQNDDTAFALFSRAAQLGDVQGKFSLAWAFNNGKGTPADPRRSGDLFLEVLRSGENAAFYAKILSDFRGNLQRETVRTLQEGMKAAGFYEGVVDGAFGPGTTEALNAIAQS